MATADSFIAVYADWAGLPEPLRLGRLTMHRAAGRETFEFEFERSVLSQPVLANLNLDPRLGLFEGRCGDAWSVSNEQGLRTLKPSSTNPIIC
jgi:hypothetical protein